METLESNEIELSPGCIEAPVAMNTSSIVTNGCEDFECGSIGAIIQPWVYKAFQDIMYNQLLIDNFSCTYVGSLTAISNYVGKELPLEQMKAGFEEYEKSGLFTPWYGGKGIDGAKFACGAFNNYFGTTISPNTVSLDSDAIFHAISSGSPINAAIQYWPEYFKNEQDDGQVENTTGTIGNKGHWITIVKINTTDPKFIQIKFVENYNGVLKYQIIFIQDFQQLRSLFMNGGVFYTGK